MLNIALGFEQSKYLVASSRWIENFRFARELVSLNHFQIN